LAVLPKGQRVTVTGGRAWISVETTVNDTKLTGFVSHDLIRAVAATGEPPKVREETKTATEAVTPTTPAPLTRDLTKLNELLNRLDVPEEEVIGLMARLTDQEVAVVSAGSSFRDLAVKAFDKEEMVKAVNALRLTGEIRHEWMKAAGITIFEIKVGPKFKDELEGVILNPELLRRVRALCQHLIDNNLVKENITLNDGVRSPAEAHRLSTAWSIGQGNVPLENLRALLPSGNDLDGNHWYEEGWTEEQIKKNAKSVWDKALAYEGYPEGDPRRAPNTQPKVSEHPLGQAIDVTIRWVNGDGWHEEAQKLVEQFGLKRPIPSEHWHFEL
jgi:hypothetical protein